MEAAWRATRCICASRISTERPSFLRMRRPSSNPITYITAIRLNTGSRFFVLHSFKARFIFPNKVGGGFSTSMTLMGGSHTMNAMQRDTIKKFVLTEWANQSLLRRLNMKEVTVKKHCQRNQIYAQDWLWWDWSRGPGIDHARSTIGISSNQK